jgi:type IV pilus assembly protein PilY1
MIGAPGADRDDVIDWFRGQDIFDSDGDGSTSDQHNQFGDPLHVRPTPVIYGGSAAAPDMVVYVSTNDGLMHAIDPDDGSELWSFIPERLLDRMFDLYSDNLSPNRQYGLDGDISMYIHNDDGLPGISGAEQVLMFFGMRRGGSALFALDVTNRTNPQLEWTIDDTDPDFADLGETWSKPVITTVDINGTKKLVAIFGGGYATSQDFDNATDSDGNAVFMVDALTGALIWSAGNDNSHDLKLDDLDYSIPAALKVLDLNLDGLADRMYVGDMGGQVWRFDIFNGDPVSTLVEGGTLATLGRRAAGFGDTDDGIDPTPNRRFYATPDAVPVVTNNNIYLTVNLGSGYRAHPNDVTTTENEFYSIRDFNVFNQLQSNDVSYSNPVLRTDLIDVTADVTTPVDPNDSGWRLAMVESAGEKVLSISNTFENTVYFTSFAPGAVANTCVGTGGLNRLYAVDIRTGAPTRDYDTTINDPDLNEDDRFKQLAQVGIAPEPVLLFPEDAPEDPIMCVGVECDDAGVTNSAQLTFWTQDGSQ